MEHGNETLQQGQAIEAPENSGVEPCATPAPEPHPLEDRVRELEGQLQKAEARAEEEKQRYLRITAEVDAKRKWLDNEAAGRIAKFKLELLDGFLRVVDNLERALQAAPRDEAQASLREGIEITLKEFYRLIEEHGVERIEPVGQVFDPKLHEAIAVRHEPDKAGNEVIELHRRGYRLDGHLLRPAQVIVNQEVSAADSQSTPANDQPTNL
jgi:molecular chaperone GrpE